ncbi:hypothetical protein F4808DRAFT_456138 [Astrocystis sublimbata]|nr:hypothetical protein F4808DRAFT_456138 [Astrocystis sublimbata]
MGSADSPNDYEKSFTAATVWSKGANKYLSQDEGTHLQPMHSQAPRMPICINALENMQASWNRHTTAMEIDEAIRFHLQSLPESVCNLISIRSGSMAFRDFWDMEENWGHGQEGDSEERGNEWLSANRGRPGDVRYKKDGTPRRTQHIETRLMQYPYHIWPINTGDQWEVIFIVMEKNHPENYRKDEKEQDYRLLYRWSNVNPRVSGGRQNPSDGDYSREENRRQAFIADRMKQIFSVCGKIQDPPVPWDKAQRMIWVPKQPEGDDWSSGLRVIQFITEMIDRIFDIESSGVRDVEKLFKPMKNYFDPHYIRMRSAGAIAANALEQASWRARIVVAPVRFLRPEHMDENEDDFEARGLRNPMLKPELEKIPQRYIETVEIDEADEFESHWKFVTHREKIDYEKIPALMEENARKYRQRLEEEKQKRVTEEAEKDKGEAE